MASYLIYIKTHPHSSSSSSFKTMANLRGVVLFPLITIMLIASPTAPFSHGFLDKQQPKQSSALVPSTTQLQYHRGSLLTAPITVYILWYGAFSPTHKSTISDFFNSFDHSAFTRQEQQQQPTVSTWWKTTQSYKDDTGKPVSATIKLSGQASDPACSVGRSLKRTDIATLVRTAIGKGVFSFDHASIYLVLTASDVFIDGFCRGSCGYHSTAPVVKGQRAVLAHVGDPGAQCPGLCAWPFAKLAYGPPGPPLVSPNGVGVDGMVINIATVLAGAATNPFSSGYFQGNRMAPLEAVTACAGIFGAGAYPGYPGKLLVNRRSNASFNAYGANGRIYLLPAIWDPSSLTCKGVIA